MDSLYNHLFQLVAWLANRNNTIKAEGRLNYNSLKLPRLEGKFNSMNKKGLFFFSRIKSCLNTPFLCFFLIPILSLLVSWQEAQAQTPCGLSMVVTPGLCQSATNSYVLSGTINATNVPTSGTLTITSAALSQPRTLTLPAANTVSGTFS
ncbi:hypothetical protein, partial [Spirosoma migulaei]